MTDDRTRTVKERAYEIASDMIGPYLLADAGQRLVADYENPEKPYIQEMNTHSQAGELYSVTCPGIGNMDMSHYREGWDCAHLDDEAVLRSCVEDGDMSGEIEDLAVKIELSIGLEVNL